MKNLALGVIGVALFVLCIVATLERGFDFEFAILLPLLLMFSLFELGKKEGSNI